MPLILPGNVASATASTTYDVDNSCRFNDGDSAYMHKTCSSAFDTDRFTISLWCKRGALGIETRLVSCDNADGSDDDFLKFDANDNIEFTIYDGGYTGKLITNAKYRDVSAWYHIVAVWDSANGTAGNRMRLYVNGTEVTSFSSDTNPTSGANATFGNTSHPIEIGRRGTNGTQYWDGYLAEVAVCDGQAYAASDFGEFDEDSPTIWKPKDISALTFGTSGFYLDFEASDNLGNDANGGTDFTEVNLAATDQASDSPTNNFCVMNPLFNLHNGTYTYEEGNLLVQSDVRRGAYSSFGVANGKWWCEAKLISFTNGGSGNNLYAIGVSSNPSTMGNDGTGDLAGDYAYSGDGNKEVADSASSYGNTYTTNDIIGIALNLDDNEVKFYKNGTVQNSGTAISITAPASTRDGFYFFNAGHIENIAKWSWNFGNPSYSVSDPSSDANGYGAFDIDTVPSGYLALCTKNLGSDGG